MHFVLPCVLAAFIIVIVVGNRRRKPTGCVRDNGIIAPVAPMPV